MEFLHQSNFADLGLELLMSRLPIAERPEVHAILSLSQESGLRSAEQICRLAAGADFLSSRLSEEGLKPAFVRWFLSDAANLEPLLPQIGDTSTQVSIVGQPPVDGNKAALWLYFLPAAPSAYTHLFSASNAIPGADSKEATTLLLDNLDNSLKLSDSSLADGCIRTWFFVRDIDRNYPGVVEGRNSLFANVGLTPATHFIASTGIAAHPWRPDVTVKMDSWSVLGLSPQQISYIQAPEFLNPTYDYGVAFERATAIDYGDRRHLLISGTASIDHKGQIVSPGDIEGQTLRMIANVSALLEAGGMEWSDVAQTIIYLRDRADRSVVERIFRQRFPLGSSAPRVIVEAPVCRQGWLVEMECMAAKEVANPAYAPF